MKEGTCTLWKKLEDATDKSEDRRHDDVLQLPPLQASMKPSWVDRIVKCKNVPTFQRQTLLLFKVHHEKGDRVSLRNVGSFLHFDITVGPIRLD
jgi:hypothetical protein